MLRIRILLIIAFSWILMLILVGIGSIFKELVFLYVISLIVVLLIYAIQLLIEIKEKLD